MILHNEYIYHKSGKILEKKDLLEGSSQLNEFDEQNNIILEHENFTHSLHTYNEKGDKIQTVKMTGEYGEGRVFEFIVREINYK